MVMKKIIPFSLPVLGAVVFLVVGANRIIHYLHYRALALQDQRIKYELQIADHIEDHKEAVAYYQNVKPLIPEVQLRILQRQWFIALEVLHQIQLSKFNSALEQDVPALYRTLKELLDGMKDRCNLLLTETELLRDEVAWRVYNMRGGVRLLTVFSILETEKNWEKVSGIMREAISDYKSAIETVDKINVPTFEKNIPRWNLELLHSEQQVKKFEFSRVEETERLNIKDNLEAIIPEKGGYAPGEPVERKIKK